MNINGRRPLKLLPLILILAALACALPFGPSATPTELPDTPIPPTDTPIPIPTPTARPSPPDLVESDPPMSSELPLNGPITLYFNQAMDRASVEAGLTSQFQQPLAFQWVDDATLIVYLDQPLQPEMTVSLNLTDAIRSQGGDTPLHPIRLSYQAAGYLRLSERLPLPDAQEVDPTGAVIAAFNRPVAALGADPATVPPGFTLEPAASGHGEWINTSTYVFYPEPGLAGGQTYTVRLTADLKSTDGGPYQDDGQAWSFTTAVPKFVSIRPSTETPWPLDPQVSIKFNQPMDPAGVEAAFSLNGPEGRIPGASAWSEDRTVFTYTVSAPLSRATIYTLRLESSAPSAGGAPLSEALAAEVITAAPLEVGSARPEAGSQVEIYSNIELVFNAPIQEKDFINHIQMTPAVRDLDGYWNAESNTLSLYGSLAPSTDYQVTVLSSLMDKWGGPMAVPYTLAFRTKPRSPNLSPVSVGRAIYLTARDTSLAVEAVNLSEAPMTIGQMTLNEFLTLLGPQGFEIEQTFQPAGAQSWSQPLSLPPDQMTSVGLPLNPQNTSLAPGLYFLRFNFPQIMGQQQVYAGPYYLVSSDVQLTFKAGAADALVWAADVHTGAPLAGLPVTIYDESGAALAQGSTDSNGLFQSAFAPVKDVYTPLYAVTGQLGGAGFGLASTGWNTGVSPYDFGLQADTRNPGPSVYIYTDRPLYRPGQTVYFRAVVRQEENGRYTAPQIDRLPLKIYGAEGTALAEMSLPLNAFGTAHGEFPIPEDARPGGYSIQSEVDPYGYLGFGVAEYRKPEINLQVSLTPATVLAGETLLGTVNARYFFDAPAGNLTAQWALYTTPDRFNLPGYRVGLEDTSWLDVYIMPPYQDQLGALVKQGQVSLNEQGIGEVQIETGQPKDRMRYTLEVTLTDESGIPVSARSSAIVNPDSFFIGVRPDAWSSRAGEPAGFEALLVDASAKPTTLAEALRADFQKVVWQRIEPDPNDPVGVPTYVPQMTLSGSVDFTAGADGKARLSFTPAEPGTFMLDVYKAGSGPELGARTQALVWIGGPGDASWPNPPNARLVLTADQNSYRPGDTAHVFVPNPFGSAAPALVTLERGKVISAQVISLPAEGATLELPLTAEHAPNAYLSVTLLGRSASGLADFRAGYINLEVAPLEYELNVTLASKPERAGPGDTVSFDLRVSDPAGNPVQGEFSLAVVDLAALALAEPNSPDILTAFYGVQPNGVRTGLTLANYARRLLDMPGGLGGGGGAEIAAVAREEFPDTAYWNAEVVTGADGMASVTVTLPDNLTTWQVDARGLTQDTRVGEGESQVVATLPLLVRPVTPRFFVAGDRVQLATVVQNNTEAEVNAQVALQADGFTLQDGASQSVSIPANGRVRVAWWGTVQNVKQVDLVFSAQAGELSDAARPANSPLPVLRYTAPQTFRTSGSLDAAGEQTELINLPRSYQAQGGDLSLELSPSLAGAMLRSLDALENSPVDSSEAILSSFLANLETYRALQGLGFDDPALKARLDRALNTGLGRLAARQNYDGGWGWSAGEASDLYVSTYVVFGLTRARLAGIVIDLDQLQRAVAYLQSAGPTRPTEGGTSGLDDQPGTLQPARQDTWPPAPYQWDRLAFREYALALNDAADAERLAELTTMKEQLSPWAQALLALALERNAPGNEAAAALFAGLQAAAERTATGASWSMAATPEGLDAAGFNMHNNLSNTAVVLFALAQHDPAATLSDEIVRFLMLNRDGSGAWGSTYATAWTLIALDQLGGALQPGDFAFSATLNGGVIAEGRAQGLPTAQEAGAEAYSPVTADTPIGRLYPDASNVLTLSRGEGSGKLYYAVGLTLDRPAEQTAPASNGLSISRQAFPVGADCPDERCAAVSEGQAGQKLRVRLTLTVPSDLHYVAVRDYIPAGAEALNPSLKTTQLGEDGLPVTEQTFDPRRPFVDGWGIWRFSGPQIYDDGIGWTAVELPAGTYELTYTIVLLQPGQFRVLPAQAWQTYFPEVYANSAGSVFEIK